MSNKDVSRRDFLKGLGAGASVLSLSPLAGGLAGCGTPPPSGASLLQSQGTVGNAPANTRTIKFLAGETCEPSTRFRLFYDTASRSRLQDYAYQTPEVGGFSQDDPIPLELTSLSRNTRYFYRLGSYDAREGWTYQQEHSFHTQRPAGERFRFCIAGDSHVYPYDSIPRKYALREIAFQNILADAPDILFTMGDDVFVGSQGPISYYPSIEENLDKTWRKAKEIIDIAGHSMLPVSVNGNHDGLFGWTRANDAYARCLDAKLHYLTVPYSDLSPEVGDPYGRYGAFTWGDCLFVWLDVVGFCPVDPWPKRDNSLYILGNDQKSFLESTLRSSSATWKFLFSHHLFGGDDDWAPGYGRGNANNAFMYEQGEIQAMMERYGAQAFFYGHDHAFSRSKANTVSYVCTGHPGSGCPWVREAQEYFSSDDIFVTDDEGEVPAGHVRVDIDEGNQEVAVSYIKASEGSDNGAVLAGFSIKP